MAHSLPETPSPLHILRGHSSPISALYISQDNERIYSGDHYGKVVVTSTRSLRPVTVWNAHKDGVLGVEEWGNHIVTHGRDDKLNVWKRMDEVSSNVGGAASAPINSTPSLAYNMDVNSLNFCRFSLLKLPRDSTHDEDRALIALPNLIDSSTADVWALPSQQRLHAAIGQEIVKSIFSADPGGRNTSGIIMSLGLFYQKRSDSLGESQLALICAYENGSIVLRRYTSDKETSVEGVGWQTIWTSKIHTDSVMAMAVSPLNDFALTVSPDHIVGRYNLNAKDDSAANKDFVAYRTKHPGNASVAIRSDSRVCAIGGWDGKIRLYSTRSLKALGTLQYHKDNIHCVTFAHYQTLSESTPTPNEDDDMSPEEIEERSRWLAAGSKDGRVSIWQLLSFTKR